MCHAAPVLEAIIRGGAFINLEIWLRAIFAAMASSARF